MVLPVVVQYVEGMHQQGTLSIYHMVPVGTVVVCISVPAGDALNYCTQQHTRYDGSRMTEGARCKLAPHVIH